MGVLRLLSVLCPFLSEPHCPHLINGENTCPPDSPGARTVPVVEKSGGKLPSSVPRGSWCSVNGSRCF